MSMHEPIYPLKQDLHLRGLDVMYPPTPLVAAKCDGTTDDSTAIQNIINSAQSNGYGIVYLPAGKSIKLNSGLTVPYGVGLVGGTNTLLDFTGLSSSGTAITFNQSNWSGNANQTQSQTFVSGHFNMTGPGARNATTSVALSVTGNNLVYEKIGAINFGTAIEMLNANTFEVTYRDIYVQACGTGINAGNSAANQGERFTFENVAIVNTNTVLIGNDSTADMYFINCSFDGFALLSSFGPTGIYNFDSCHIETSASAVTPNNYIADFKTGSGDAQPVVNFDKCSFLITDIPYVINPAATGNNGGLVTFEQCFAAFRATTTSTNALETTSEPMLHIASGATSTTLDTPFICPFAVGLASVEVVGAGPGTTTPAGISPGITMAASGTNRITATVASSPASDLYLRAKFG